MDKDFKMTNINRYITNGNLRIKVKTNSENTEIIGYDDAGKVIIVNVAARPEGDKANLEIIKFFSSVLSCILLLFYQRKYFFKILIFLFRHKRKQGLF